MAHYAKIGLNNKIIAVNPVDDNIILNADGREDDDLAIRHLISTTGWPFWIKCISYVMPSYCGTQKGF